MSQSSPKSQDTKPESDAVEQELHGAKRFKMKRIITQTLQGRLYYALDRQRSVSGKPVYVAVKECWKRLVKSKKSRTNLEVKENFPMEKRIHNYLSKKKDANEGFVKTIEEWEDDECYYLACEYCSGGDLFDYCKNMHAHGEIAELVDRTTANVRSGGLQRPARDDASWVVSVRKMWTQIAESVAFFHRYGVCHLDLSLENCILTSKDNPTPKIIDFGLARKFRIKDVKYSAHERVGKTGYMAPEVYRKCMYDARAADVWSLGVMLFMMLVGSPPYKYPAMSDAAFQFVISGRLREALSHWKRLPLVSQSALDLLKKIFRYESDRISLDEILKHPFITGSSPKKAKSASTEELESKEEVKEEPDSSPQPQPSSEEKAAPEEADERAEGEELVAQQPSSPVKHIRSLSESSEEEQEQPGAAQGRGSVCGLDESDDGVDASPKSGEDEIDPATQNIHLRQAKTLLSLTDTMDELQTANHYQRAAELWDNSDNRNDMSVFVDHISNLKRLVQSDDCNVRLPSLRALELAAANSAVQKELLNQETLDILVTFINDGAKTNYKIMTAVLSIWNQLCCDAHKSPQRSLLVGGFFEDNKHMSALTDLLDSFSDHISVVSNTYLLLSRLIPLRPEKFSEKLKCDDIPTRAQKTAFDHEDDLVRKNAKSFLKSMHSIQQPHKSANVHQEEAKGVKGANKA